MDDTRAEEIQKFLSKQLKLTPRRQMFEEYEKKSESIRCEKLDMKEVRTATESINKFDLQIIGELSDFRKNHPRECMSNVNWQRLKRAKEREDEFLKQACPHRLLRGGSLRDKQGKSFCESTGDMTTIEEEPVAEPSTSTFKHVHFPPDRSLALTHHKFKC